MAENLFDFAKTAAHLGFLCNVLQSVSAKEIPWGP